MSEVVVAAPTRDEDWLRGLIAEHQRHVKAYARRRLSAEDADEVVADVFAIAWRRRAEMPADVPVLAWLYGVARNRISLIERSEQRRSRVTQRLFADRTALVGVVDTGGVGSSSSGVEDQAARVRQALATLRPAEQEVLRLLTWEELSHHDAAHVLQCSVNAVAIRAHRARRSLAQALLRLAPTGRSS
ncbi:MAG: RNA polymerase sigma factor [Dermatophilaceae bacterium]